MEFPSPIIKRCLGAKVKWVGGGKKPALPIPWVPFSSPRKSDLMLQRYLISAFLFECESVSFKYIFFIHEIGNLAMLCSGL